VDTEWTKVKSVECLGEVDDYVYDLSINDQDPFFFGNDILLHNTDSAYFTAYPALKDQIAKEQVDWSTENIIALYDSISDQANTTFPAFMEKAFHCPRKQGEIIQAGREIVGDRGLFITKKRYAINIVDKEGKRKDIDGKPGEIKAMGLDLKRADTPKYIQEFLMSVLTMVLSGKSKEEVIDAIKDFKKYLSTLDSWMKGSPKGANKITYYAELEKRSKTGKANMPGHVRAAINWNYLRYLHGDNYSMKLVDGMKLVVCKLKPNPLNFTSVAYPTDELRIPEWFKQLPFDDKLMEETLVDKKIENLLGVLDWNLAFNTVTDNTFDDLFTFG
jgi:hypothetical protein